MQSDLTSERGLAATITRTASKHTYYTIRFLVDTGLVEDAYRAYAYFRWVDDWLDQKPRPRVERMAFVKRQQDLIDGCAHTSPLADLAPEERLVVGLIQRDTDNSGLQAYIRNLMAVMAFDAARRGRLIAQRELNEYTHWLAVAVTEALHYFIGHNGASPQGEIRYMAVTGAHITHMLRDTLEDAKAGYFNIPSEIIDAKRIDPCDVASDAYRDWVSERVCAARACFRIGRDYLAHVENLRCRIAGYAYIHCFEAVLDDIERADYKLQACYPARTGRGAGLAGWALWMALTNRGRSRAASTLNDQVHL